MPPISTAAVTPMARDLSVRSAVTISAPTAAQYMAACASTVSCVLRPNTQRKNG
jgi:hypothetical protein